MAEAAPLVRAPLVGEAVDLRALRLADHPAGDGHTVELVRGGENSLPVHDHLGGQRHLVALVGVEQVEVDLLDAAEGDEVSLTATLLVDGDTVLATPDQLSGVTVTGRVVGEAKGPKINGFTYKRRTNNRRRYGHRQRYTVVEITKIAQKNK